MIKVLNLIYSDWKRYTRLHKKMNFFLFLIVLFRNPGMYFSVMYRIEYCLLGSPFIIFKFLGIIFYPIYFIVTYYILDIDISPKAKIGKALYIHNKGIILSDRVVAGENLTLIGPLTMGVKNLVQDPSVDNSSSPHLGNNVSVGTGARVLGGIKIGDNVQIGANAVVLKDVPSNCTVGGIPAKILK